MTKIHSLQCIFWCTVAMPEWPVSEAMIDRPMEAAAQCADGYRFKVSTLKVVTKETEMIVLSFILRGIIILLS